MTKQHLIFFGLLLFLTGGVLYYMFMGDGPISLKYSSVSSYINYIMSKENNQIEPVKVKISPKKRDKLAVIPYLPSGMHQTYHFITLLYGSWRFIIDHQREFFPGDEINDINVVDLLVFCHPSICKQIHSICPPIQGLSRLNTSHTISKCWAVEQPFEVDIPYGPLNSFIMFNRTDILELIPRYKYLLRTDNDAFLTPAIYRLKPQVFLFGHGGYSDPFNMKRLKEVADRLGMKHRGRHAIGSTWCGDTAFFIKAARKTLETTRYVYLNEFDPKAKGLETIDFNKNREGEWIRWWRPVSLLYGGEISLNDLIENISDKNMGKFDSSSCDKINIWETPHIHCWHNDCEFQKFRFMKYLNIAINSRESLPGKVVHRIISSVYPKNITVMNLKEYSEYIAWSSVGKYLRKQFI